MWVRGKGSEHQNVHVSLFRADSGTNLIKQGESVNGRPCGSVAQLAECLHGKREALGSSPGRATIISSPVTPTSGHDGNEVHNFYRQLQEIIDQTPKKDNLVVQGDWNAKVRRDAQAD